ncbi:phage late control D family protein [Methylobacterium sp. A54F]
MREPAVALTYGTRDLMPVWGPLLVSVTITDEKGIESDKLVVELDDKDGQCVYPGVGEVVTVEIGYVGEAGRVRGEFEIDQIDMEGWPQKITIHGTPVSAKKATKENRTEAHKKEDTPTVGDLAKKIAKRNGWTPKVASEIAKIPVEYEGQAGETDAAFLTRLARRYGAILTVKQGRMVMTKAAAGKSASGLTLPALKVAPGVNLVSYRASWKGRERHGKAQAHYFDRRDVKRIDVDAGQGEITYRLRQPFKSRDEAKRAAEAAVASLARQEGSATFVIEGDTAVGAEQPIDVSGIRGRVDGRWNATRAEHQVEDGKYLTTLECETPGSESGEGGSSEE